MENIKIGDLFEGSNGLFIVENVYIENNKFWIELFHIESGQHCHHVTYEHFSYLLSLKKVNWDYIRQATQEEYEDIRLECNRIADDNMIGGFSRINFIDYSNYIIKLVEEFPQLVFKLQSFGLSIDKKEE
jgi:hypothetical protein